MDRSPAFVLHVRPFRETSRLIDFFTPDFGRVRAVARARARRRGGSGLPGPFSLLSIRWVGRSDLKTLRDWEPIGPPFLLQGHRLYSALYLNEVLYRLLHESDAQPRLYELYAEALAQLAGSTDIEIVLRRFELALLEELGYGIDLACEAESGEPLQPSVRYVLDPERGLIRADNLTPGRHSYPGESLLALGAGHLDEPEVKRVAKQLLRAALAVHLGDRPLQSRALFQPPR